MCWVGCRVCVRFFGRVLVGGELGLVWRVAGVWVQEALCLLFFLWVSLHAPKKCRVMS